MMLSTKKHVLICLSELRQPLSQLTKVLSLRQKQLYIVDTTLTLTFSIIDKVTIRTHWLGIMLLLGKACQRQIRYLIEFSSPRFNRTFEPLQPIAFLSDIEQQNNLVYVRGPMHATKLDQDV